MQVEFVGSVYWMLLLLSFLPLVFSFRGIFGSFELWKLHAVGGEGALGWFAVAQYDVFMAIGIGLALCAAILFRPVLFIGAAAPIAVAIAGQFEPGSQAYVYATVAVALSYLASLALFAVKGRFLSAPVAFFAVIVFYDTVVQTMHGIVDWLWNLLLRESVPWTLDARSLLTSRFIKDGGANLIDLISFFVILVFLRFVFHLVDDNRVLAGRLWEDRSKLRPALAKAGLMWAPVPAAFAIFVFWLYPSFDAFVEDKTMGRLKDHLLCRNLDPEDRASCTPYVEAEDTPAEFEPMMRLMIDISAREMDASARQGVEEMASLTLSSVDDLRNKAFPILATKVLPGRMPGTETRGCSKLDMACHGANGAKSLANSGYRRLRDPPLRALEAEIENAYYEANKNVGEFQRLAEERITRSVSQFRARSNLAVDKAITAMAFMGAVSLVYSLMILAKTFAIALARVIFSHQERYGFLARLSAGSDAPARKPVKSTIAKKTKSPLGLRGDGGRNYYIHRERQVSDGIGYPYIPYPWKSIWTRRRHGNYTMQYYSLSQKRDARSVGIQFEPTERVITVKIARGEKVVFDFADVIGLSAGLRVKTMVTLSLHGLVFGKALYRFAEGEGELILCIEGEPTILASEESQTSENRRDPQAIVAWHLDTPFKIQSDLSMKGLLISGYNVEKQAGGFMILHNNRIKGGASKMGIARFVRTFLSPI
ncbi:MAG: hypothetical protein AB7L41_03100 [Flavobacteriaceae bacterium]